MVQPQCPDAQGHKLSSNAVASACVHLWSSHRKCLPNNLGSTSRPSLVGDQPPPLVFPASYSSPTLCTLGSKEGDGRNQNNQQSRLFLEVLFLSISLHITGKCTAFNRALISFKCYLSSPSTVLNSLFLQSPPKTGNTPKNRSLYTFTFWPWALTLAQG